MHILDKATKHHEKNYPKYVNITLQKINNNLVSVKSYTLGMKKFKGYYYGENEK